jgi:nucleoside-diphosphate-sugar epimerase
MFQRVPSIDKIRSAIGWQPTVSLDAILEPVISEISASSEAAVSERTAR